MLERDKCSFFPLYTRYGLKWLTYYFLSSLWITERPDSLLVFITLVHLTWADMLKGNAPSHCLCRRGQICREFLKGPLAEA
jgi:hypothetical protein